MPGKLSDRVVATYDGHEIVLNIYQGDIRTMTVMTPRQAIYLSHTLLGCALRTRVL